MSRNVQITPEARSTEVYVLTSQGAGPALRPHTEPQGGGVGFLSFSVSTSLGNTASMFPMDGFSLSGMPAAMLASSLEEILGKPVVDETGLTEIHDIELRASIQNREAFIRALRDEAGLIVTPAQRDIQVLVVRPTSPS